MSTTEAEYIYLSNEKCDLLPFMVLFKEEYFFLISIIQSQNYLQGFQSQSRFYIHGPIKKDLTMDKTHCN